MLYKILFHYGDKYLGSKLETYILWFWFIFLHIGWPLNDREHRLRPIFINIYIFFLLITYTFPFYKMVCRNGEKYKTHKCRFVQFMINVKKAWNVLVKSLLPWKQLILYIMYSKHIKDAYTTVLNVHIYIILRKVYSRLNIKNIVYSG